MLSDDDRPIIRNEQTVNVYVDSGTHRGGCCGCLLWVAVVIAILYLIGRIAG